MGDKESGTFFVTKYALTQGILEVSGYLSSGYLYYGSDVHTQVVPKDWFRDRVEAVKRARELRAKRIKSLENQIVKLRKLGFE